MARGGAQGIAENRQVLAHRLANYLATQFRGPSREKRLAQCLNCDPRTARTILDGHWPGARHWRAIVIEFGHDVLAAVFEPDIDATQARLDAEIRALEATLNARKAALRAVARREESFPPRPLRAA